MKVSIIMPTYNDSSTIIDTIDSVVNQSYTDWQLIIMNDGSTDNVEDVIKQYRENSDHKEKIEYYSQKNQDQLNAIRNCIDYIKGEFVYILHSDDLLPDNNLLMRLVEEAKANPDTKVFIGDLITIDEKKALEVAKKAIDENLSVREIENLVKGIKLQGQKKHREREISKYSYVETKFKRQYNIKKCYLHHQLFSKTDNNSWNFIEICYE